jgi:hypothetical protein
MMSPEADMISDHVEWPDVEKHSGLTSWLPCFAVAAATGVFTYHNDVGRTGQNVSEVLLSPDSVNSTRFGKLFSHLVDGDVYAQPLYLADLSVPGKGVHNAVIIATAGDGRLCIRCR